jgi:hypothetical protein
MLMALLKSKTKKGLNHRQVQAAAKKARIFGIM